MRKQLYFWIGALVLGALLGTLGIAWLDKLMTFVATVYTRLFQLLAVPTIVLAVITTLASFSACCIVFIDARTACSASSLLAREKLPWCAIECHKPSCSTSSGTSVIVSA